MEKSFEQFVKDSLRGKNAESAIVSFMDYKPEDVQDSEIDINWIVRFSDYIRDRAKSPNTQRVYFTIFRGLLSKAQRRGYKFPVNLLDVAEELKAQQEASENIYTSKDELILLEGYKTELRYEQFARAVYLLCAYTGCRFNDHKFITETCISDNTVSYTSEKTKITARIPMHPLVPVLISELKKFNYAVNSEKKILDSHIKEIFRKLGVTKTVSLYKRGQRLVGQKCDFVSAHTARISFATNLYIDGYSIEQVKQMMGHANSEMTSRYVKVSINDFITGDKNYLFPNKPNAASEKIKAMLDGGISEANVRTMMGIMGFSANDIDKAFNIYGNTQNREVSSFIY